MAVTLRAGSAGVTVPAPGTTQPVTLPSGAQTGDLVQIYCAGTTASNSFSCPGFKSLSPVSGSGGGSMQLLYKINLTDAPGTIYTVTASSADTWGAIIVSDGQTDQALVFDGTPSAGQVNTSSLLIGTPVPVPAFPGARLNWFGFALLPSGTAQIYQPPGFTIQVPQVNSTLAAPSQNIAMMFADWTPPRPSPVPPPFIAGSASQASGVSTTLTVPITTTTGLGDDLIIAIGDTAGSGDITKVTDSSGGNNWTLDNAVAGSNLTTWRAWGSAVLTGGSSSVTVTLAGTTGNVVAVVVDDPSALQQDIAVNGSNASGTTASVSTGVLNASTEMILSFTWVGSAGSAPVQNAPMTGLSVISGGAAGFLAPAYDIVSSSASVTASSSWTGAAPLAEVVLTFIRPWFIEPGAVVPANINGGVMIALPPGQPVPQVASPPRNRLLRALFGPRARRGAAVVIPQQTGTQFPLAVRNRSPRLYLAVQRLNRQRFISPPQVQGPLAPPFIPPPVPNRFRPLAAYLHPRPRTSDNRIEVPPLPQGPQAPSWLQVPVVRPGWRRFAPRLSRGKVTLVVPPQQAQGAPWLGSVSPKRRPWAASVVARYYKRRIFAPQMPQGAQAPAWVQTQPRRTRQRPFWFFRRQPRWFMKLIPKVTVSGVAHLTSASTLTVSGTRQVNAVTHMTSSSRMTVAALPVARAGSAALTQQSRLTAKGLRTKVGTATLNAASTLTANGIVRKIATASFTSSSTLTAAATTGSGALLQAPSRLTATALLTQLPTATLSAPSTMFAQATAGPLKPEIIIPPLVIPGAGEGGLKPGQRDPQSTQQAIIRGTVDPGIFDAPPGS